MQLQIIFALLLKLLYFFKSVLETNIVSLKQREKNLKNKSVLKFKSWEEFLAMNK